MRNMYDSRLKEAAIKKIEQGMSATSISRELNIPRQTIQYWSKNCGSAPTTAYTRRKDYSLEKKLEIIKLWDNGVPIREISEQQGINKSTVSNWIRDRNRLLAVYSVQEAHPGVMTSPDRMARSEKRLPDMNSKEERELKRHNRDLKSENEYLRARVAYLEALMELSGIPASGFKKNSVIKPSTAFSDGKSET